MIIQKAILMLLVVISLFNLFLDNCHGARVVDSTSVWLALIKGDNTKAYNDAKILVKASDDMVGHYVLGELYSRGAGVKKNYSKACNHWFKAAKKGLPLAQNNLGNMYEEGLGVEKNCKIAFTWYLRSLNPTLGKWKPTLDSDVKKMALLFSRGPGLYSIGNMYLNGKSCLKKDSGRASFWLGLSATDGFFHAIEALKNSDVGDIDTPVDKWLKTKPENVVETYQLAFLMTLLDGPFKVIHVYDGDTIVIKGKKAKLIVQLALIDAPEPRKKKGSVDQPFSIEAKSHLSRLVLNKEVKFKCYDISYNNVFMGLIFIDDMNINLSMVEAGFAEVIKKNIRGGFNIDPYRSKEIIARKARKGIWSLGEKYISPAEWRKKK